MFDIYIVSHVNLQTIDLIVMGFYAIVSLLTAPPSAAVVERFVWSPAYFHEESKELAGLPWFKNFRVLSALLLITAAIFVYIWR